jgi:hypothetical protein
MSSLDRLVGRHWLPVAIVAVLATMAPGAAVAFGNVCGQTSIALQEACRADAADAQRVGFAICLNLTHAGATAACKEELEDSYADALEECSDVRDARDYVCGALGRAAYDPVIRPKDFVSTITNPYAPFQPGRWWEYRKVGEEGIERNRVEVLSTPRWIQGVKVTQVRDRVWLDGELVEDTIDWVAQHRNGDVRYFGELAKNYEDGLLVNLDGSFEAGKEGAKSGIWVRGNPRVGEFYRQEWAPSEAEDVVKVLSLDAQERVPFRGSKHVMKTRDFTPLEPGVLEYKFYVPGIGLVMELDQDGEKLKLVDYGPR